MKKYAFILQSHKGFTLIELLVVISIIGLLASVVLVSLNNSRAKARDAKRVADTKHIATALELYLDDWGGYPTTANYTTNGANGMVPNYVSSRPVEPLPADGSCSTAQNTYTYTASGTAYASPKNGAVNVHPLYTFTFCLGANTGSYTDTADAGSQVQCTLSPAGVTCL